MNPYRILEGYCCDICRAQALKVRTMHHPAGTGAVDVCYACLGEWAAKSGYVEVFFAEGNSLGLRTVCRVGSGHKRC